jgi:hypothetical protein
LLITLAACSPPDYGTKLSFNNGELYFTQNVTESEALRLGNFLVEDGFFYGEKITVQLDKAEDTYLFRMVTTEGTEDNQDYIAEAKKSTGVLSKNVFHDAPVNFHICDDRLKTKTEIQFTPILAN